MENIPIGLAKDLIVDILLIKVRVKTTRSGFATYIDKRHHGIIADILERKWGIGINK